ncbi:MoaF-related domain-containing protein [Shewanella colwelliana]|uniref:MoaF-related domain-containing protein n=1 Tax=Shewanella colwelliana TaxID=23 RepID=UPI00299E77A7|nr:MoaF N-terminal domain-containing protein [Shewanella colwelliana]MDX1279582.1 MoaF N-terminal domain-containing protein [Shewanella colwelliana]
MKYLGKMVEYSYEVGEAYSIKFSQNHCTWLCTQGNMKGATGDELYSATEVASNVLFVSWLEGNGEVVSLVLNFDEMRIYCSYVEPAQGRHQWEGTISYWGPIK